MGIVRHIEYHLGLPRQYLEAPCCARGLQTLANRRLSHWQAFT